MRNRESRFGAEPSSDASLAINLHKKLCKVRRRECKRRESETTSNDEAGSTPNATNRPPQEESDIEEIVRDVPIPGTVQSHYEDDSYELPRQGSPRPEYTGRIPVEHEVPDWFPKNIKKIFLKDRHGGQLTYNELEAITRYRAAMELTKRRKWKAYNSAGQDRYKLQKLLRRKKCSPYSVRAFYKFRKQQFKEAKIKALRCWKKLERLHLGVRVLDEAIDISFRQERLIHEKALGKELS